MLVLPMGLLSAVYLSVCRVQLRRIVKPVLELLAGIPTVVYGCFAAVRDALA
jgi:phosphate transport system permease protein